jgi:hypothetical protein
MYCIFGRGGNEFSKEGKSQCIKIEAGVIDEVESEVPAKIITDPHQINRKKMGITSAQKEVLLKDLIFQLSIDPAIESPS